MPFSSLSCATLAALLAAASATTEQSRDTVSINFGWRFAPDANGPAHGGDAHGPAVNSTAPAVDAKQAQTDFDDSSWAVIDIPHDASVSGNYASSENGGEGFLPLARTWYRKKLIAPKSWDSKTVTLVVDAALSTTTWYFNGNQLLVQNPVGYLPTILELNVKPGENTLACYVDGGLTTGWWYEGSGLIRSARLVITSSAAAVAPFGISSPSFVDGTISQNGPKTSDGLQAPTVVMSPTATVVGTHAKESSVQFTIVDSDGAIVATAQDAGGKFRDKEAPGSEPPSSTVKSAVLHLNNTQLWSVARPYMYLLRVDVSIDGTIVDSTTQSVGVRSLAWDAEKGLKVNEQRVKMRGACNHESFTGVGAALPDRVDLLRVQQMRGVGMNAWRTSHNPPEPVLLDLADRLGVLVLDENRVLATDINCQGSGCKNVPAYDGDPAADMGSLAKRDRNHPSVAWYSLCNEAGCGNGTLLAGDLVERAKEASYSNDGSRNVGANMGWISPVSPRTPMSDALDVMGMSHASSSSVQAFHEMEPDKPLAMTECCSCQNQRGEDADQPHNKTSVHYNSEVAGCLEQQTSTSDDPEYVAGTFVWTLHDYMGEPGAWPHVSSSFGAIDLAGFPKPPAWFYRSKWLSNVSESDAGRPPVSNSGTTIRIVENWEAPKDPETSSRTVHVYTNAALVSLELNGVAVGQPQPGGSFGKALPTFQVKFASGKLTAKALASDGSTVLGTHSVSSWGTPTAINLTMDVPSISTGTGTAVYMDGMDVALLRATIVDADGNPVLDATDNVTFTVQSGPGFVAGVGNGDPSCQEPSQVAWRSSYHGLTRAIIRVTVDASGTPTERALRASVNPDAGKGLESRSSTVLQGDASSAPKTIEVTASASGLTMGTLMVPLSVDPKDEVLAVATTSVGLADNML